MDVLNLPTVKLPSNIKPVSELKNAYLECFGKNKVFYVLFCDGNRFKQINTDYGHIGGNRAIEEMAGGISNCLTNNDTAVRFGGDEFIIFLGESRKSKVRKRIEEIQKIIKLKTKLFKINSEDIRTTPGFDISVGAVRYDPKKHLSLGDVIAEANQYLFIAKTLHNNYCFIEGDVIKRQELRKKTNISIMKRNYFEFVSKTIMDIFPDTEKQLLEDAIRQYWRTNSEYRLLQYSHFSSIRGNISIPEVLDGVIILYKKLHKKQEAKKAS